MRLPEGWSEAEVLRCAARILDEYGYDLAAVGTRWCADELDPDQQLAATAAPDDQGEKEAGGDS